MRTCNARRKVVSALTALLAVIAVSTTALAGSVHYSHYPVVASLPAPRIISSSEADTGVGNDPQHPGQSTLTMNLPSGVRAGQFLLAVVAIQGSNPLVQPWASIILPAGGWTEIAPQPRNCGPDLAMSIAYRIAQTTDTPATTFTWGILSDGFLAPALASGGIVSIANISARAPVYGVGGVCANSFQLTANPFFAPVNNSLNLLIYGITGNNFLSVPRGYSQPFQHIVSGMGPDIAVDSKLIPLVDTYTGVQISNAAQAGDNFGYQIMLNPLP